MMSCLDPCCSSLRLALLDSFTVFGGHTRFVTSGPRVFGLLMLGWYCNFCLHKAGLAGVLRWYIMVCCEAIILIQVTFLDGLARWPILLAAFLLWIEFQLLL